MRIRTRLVQPASGMLVLSILQTLACAPGDRRTDTARPRRRHRPARVRGCRSASSLMARTRMARLPN